MGVVDVVHQCHQVRHLPRRGHQPGQLQLERVISRVVGNVGIHAVHISLQPRPRGIGQLLGVGLAIALHTQHAHADVAGQGIGAKGGGQLTPPGGTEQLHLHQPVLRGHETLCTDEVGRVLRKDVGHTQLVAQHLDRRGQPRQLHAAIDLQMPGRIHHAPGRYRPQQQHQTQQTSYEASQQTHHEQHPFCHGQHGQYACPGARVSVTFSRTERGGWLYSLPPS